MIEIKGKFNTAVCYCTGLDASAAEQIKAVCDQKEFRTAKIRIMPDVHTGMGCTIGTTMTITDKIVPGMVGVDIGCGMEVVKIAEKQLDFDRLDVLIREKIPVGMDVRKDTHSYSEKIDMSGLRCAKHTKLIRAKRSIGTLGGGNHFIEVDRSSDGSLYVIVHSGSRHIGNEVARYYQEQGFRYLCGSADPQIRQLISRMKKEGREKEISTELKRIRQQEKTAALPKTLAYVEGELFDDYMHDMKLVQRFAVLNRRAIMEIIMTGMDLTGIDEFTTIHNYVDTEAMVLRKGAVSARRGEKLLIPINMRDGSLICSGKGNGEWNCSAPHGAGRAMSRRRAFDTLSMEEYESEMKDIYTSCVIPETLDESPMAYKDMDDIVSQISPTADIIEHIKPVYNFKAAE